MLRAIERGLIFVDDPDREEFLRRLARLVIELGFVCFAWALMPNHVHLVIRSGLVRVSRLMARLGTGYARYDRVGHLFQNRFRSRRVIDDSDLLGLVIYVTRNPLEARLVTDAAELERFPWCGLARSSGGAPGGRSKPWRRRSASLLRIWDRHGASCARVWGRNSRRSASRRRRPCRPARGRVRRRPASTH